MPTTAFWNRSRLCVCMPDGTPRAMAVLTNKPVRPARAICEGLGMGCFFLHLRRRQFPPQEARSLGLRSIMQEAGALPTRP